MINPARLTDEQVEKLREEKVPLNRKARRATGMSVACIGIAQGLLECRTAEGTCPEYDVCHGTKVM